MSFDLAHIWSAMGPLAKSIAGVLLLMAIASIGVVVERLWAFSKSAKESRAFVKKVGPLLKSWDITAVAKVAEEHDASALARLFRSIATRYLHGHEVGEAGMTAVEMARNEAERARKKPSVPSYGAG